MKTRILNLLKIVFFLGLGVFFIWLFMHNLTPEEKKEIYSSFLSADYLWIGISILIGIFSHISRAVRWKIMMEPMGYSPGLKNTFLAVMIGYFANMALPRLGEVTRCGILARYEKIPMQKSFGTVVTERGIDLITLSSVFLLTFLIHFDKLALFRNTSMYMNASERYNQMENPGMIYWIALGVVALFIFILYRFRHKISHLAVYKTLRTVILGFLEGLKSLVSIKKPFWFIFHSLNIWVMYLLMTWIVFYSIPETSGLGLDVGLAVLVFGSIGIIIVQGGIGIYPWIVAEILAIFLVPETKGYAMGWLLWTGQTLMIIIFGIVAMGLLPLLNKRQYGLSGAE